LAAKPPSKRGRMPDLIPSQSKENVFKTNRPYTQNLGAPPEHKGRRGEKV